MTILILKIGTKKKKKEKRILKKKGLKKKKNSFSEHSQKYCPKNTCCTKQIHTD